MKRFYSSVAMALIAILLLSGCSRDKNDEPDDEGLQAGNNSSVSTAPEELPDPPVLDFEPDLTTPEGAIKAFYAYLTVGDGVKACSLLSNKAKTAYGTVASCETSIKDYSKAVLPELDNELSLDNAIEVFITNNNGSQANGEAITSVSGDDGFKYVENFTVQKTEDIWMISDVARLGQDFPTRDEE